MRRGAQSFPFTLTMDAPICESGCMMRRMGLEDMESSPEIIVVKGWGASIPEMIRVVVPLLPVYSLAGSEAGQSPRMPFP